MNRLISDGNKRRYFVLFIVIWAVQMAAAFYFCTQKAGFHEDEYYTYYSTARTAGFYVEDGKWMDAETYRNEFVVLPGQQFQYGLVRQVQSWDVHPPVYYWIFHTAASFVPGVFSKWIGLGINLFFHGIVLILLTYLSYLAGNRNEKLALMVTLFYGLTPAAVSGVVFIRMYELLTVFVLVCALLHVKAVYGVQEDKKLSFIQFLLPMMLTTYLGFLTQYYYFIFLFYIGTAFCVFLLWHDKNLWNCVRYGVSQIIAFGLAYLTYPSCLGQMFRGQRGAQAAENFFDLSNTMMRFRFFLDLLDVYVFGKLLAGFLLLVMGLFLLLYFIRSRGKLLAPETVTVPWQPYGILCFGTAGYFMTVAKTALLLGDTSNRYQLPVYGMIVLLLFGAIYMMWGRCVPKQKAWPVFLLTAAVCLVIDLVGLTAGRVVFLYPEDREQTAFARKQAAEGVPVIYLYNEGADWCIWDVANELMEYDGVYFAAAGGTDPIQDAVIANAPSLVAYVADGADVQAQIDRIMAGNEKLTDYVLQYEEKYCDVYYFYGGK